MNAFRPDPGPRPSGPRCGFRSRPRSGRGRRGLSLLEVLAASAVLAAALAPALRVTRSALLAADAADRRERCLTVAADRLERLMAAAAADWAGTVDGTPDVAAADAGGYPGLRVYALASDRARYGGLPGRLAAVGALAWSDDDGDGRPDPGEPQALLVTAVARLTAYEHHARR